MALSQDATGWPQLNLQGAPHCDLNPKRNEKSLYAYTEGRERVITFVNMKVIWLQGGRGKGCRGRVDEQNPLRR